MGRISKKNPRYRSRKQMAADVAFILTAPVSYAAKAAVINQVCWAWTEFEGKYDGCEHWTVLALKQCGAPEQRKRGWRKLLAHEHAVPRKVVLDLMMDLEHPDEKEVFELLDRLLVGVVLLREEHDLLNGDYQRTMPEGFSDAGSERHLDPWLRYRAGRAAAAGAGMPDALRVVRVCDGVEVVS